MIQFCLTGFSTACFVLSAGGAQASSLPHAKATAFLEELQLSSKNLGLAGEVLDADPDLDASAVLVAVSEANQGGTDLNGDGDTFDSVLHVLPRGSDVLVNLGLALPTGGVPVQAAHIAGDQVLFLVREVEQGVDLNGDGDTLDMVAHVHDVRVGSTTNLALACSTDLRVGRGSGIVWVFESAQGGVDLNGDGDTLDRVAHHVELASGAVQNLGVAYGVFAAGSGDEALWGFGVSETDQGADLDGDGRLSSIVPYLYQPSTGSVTVLASPDLRLVRTKFGRAALIRNEFLHGADLNGDGDLFDDVIEIAEPATGTTIPTGLAMAQTGSGLLLYFTVQLAEDYAALQVYEFQQGTDLNGDGDLRDLVTVVIDLTTGAVLEPGLNGTPFLSGSRLLQSVWEYSQGFQDLNGDGDLLDSVVNVFDLATWTGTNLALTGTPTAPGAHLSGFVVSESNQGHQDLNQDGDTHDKIWHLHEFATGSTVNLAFDSGGAFDEKHTGSDFFVFLAYEFASGNVDLNGDGDDDDLVVMVYDVVAGTLTTPMLSSVDLGAMSGRRIVFTVHEKSQGQVDLNGDGDAFDYVVHILDIP